MRALLRADIYGHDQDDFKVKGLKDVIADVEIRQKARHAMVDAHRAAGHQVGGHAFIGQSYNCENPAGEKMFACLQIIGIAKRVIDDLIIA